MVRTTERTRCWRLVLLVLAALSCAPLLFAGRARTIVGSTPPRLLQRAPPNDPAAVASGGVCLHAPQWAPHLSTALAAWRPSSVTQADVHATFVAAAVGTWAQIIDGKLRVRAHPKGYKYPLRRASIVAQLARLLSRGWELPNVNILFDVADRPRLRLEHWSQAPAPVGSMSSNPSFLEVAIPDMAFWVWPELGRHDAKGVWRPSLDPYGWVLNQTLVAADNIPYASRLKRAVFRGSCNIPLRKRLVALTPSHPTTLDFACTDNSTDRMPWLDSAKYAVTVNAMGAGYSSRTKLLLALGSPMVYVLQDMTGGGPLNQFFYPLMTPHVHYVPVPDVGAVPSAVASLLDDPARAESMAAAATAFVKTHLTPEAVDCYWLYYLRALAERSTGGVEPAPESVVVPLNMSLADIDILLEYTPWAPPLPRQV